MIPPADQPLRTKWQAAYAYAYASACARTPHGPRGNGSFTCRLMYITSYLIDKGLGDYEGLESNAEYFDDDRFDRGIGN